MVADELGGGGGVQVGVVRLVPHPGVHHRRWGGALSKQGFKGCKHIYKDRTGNCTFQQNSTCGPIQLLDLCFVSVDEELVQVVLGRGLVVVPPAQEDHL